MPKDKKINIRLTEKEKSIIESKAKKLNMTITKFIVSSCLKDKIVIVNGLDKVDTELRRIGNNINQLTRLANEKIITVIDLKELRMEVNNIWQLEIGVSIIPKKKKTNYIKRNEYRVAEQGKSWKFKLMNAIDLSLAESNCKDDFIKNMNKLGYQVNWTDARKYITYTTPEGYKSRDNKLYDEKYSKGAMENEFRRIEKEQSNSTRKSSSSFNSKDGLLSNKTRDNKGFISNGTSNSRRYNNYEKESTRCTGKVIKGQYSNERRNEEISRRKIERSILQSETRIERNGRGTEKQDFQNKMENRINNILGGIIAISNMVSNSQINHRPKRKIRRYRILSKQAMKEYAMKKANSSSFDWFEDEEEI